MKIMLNLSLVKGKEKVKFRSILSYVMKLEKSNWNMISIIIFLMEEIVFQKKILMLPLCIWRKIIWEIKKFENIVTDVGYESEENYVYVEEHGQTSYIKSQFYEKQKKKFKLDISKRENIEYDSEDDEYICALGRRLKRLD